MAFTVYWKDGAVQYETHREYQLDAMRKRHKKLTKETLPAETPVEIAPIKQTKKKAKKVG